MQRIEWDELSYASSKQSSMRIVDENRRYTQNLCGQTETDFLFWVSYAIASARKTLVHLLRLTRARNYIKNAGKKKRKARIGSQYPKWRYYFLTLTRREYGE